MATQIIQSIAETRSEAIFLPPALFGYISYLESSLMLAVISGFAVMGAAVLHEFLTQMSELEEKKDDIEMAEIIVLLPDTRLFQAFVAIIVVIFAILFVVSPMYGSYLFYDSFDLYLGAGLFLYVIFVIKLGDWIGESEEITDSHRRAIELVEQTNAGENE